MNDPRLELPVDQYQRYRVTADLLDQLALAPPARVLEVGGAPGPLEEFLPGFETVVSDVSGSHKGRFVVADGHALPFDDESFDAVVALDVLEHVPSAGRGQFLAELRRSAANVVIVCAPFADEHVRLAEDAVSEFVRARFGEVFETLDWLGEHAEHGHPDLDASVASFRDAGWRTAVLPSGYLPRWLAVMLVDHELLATGLPELGKLHAYYNAAVSPLDAREPAYRHVIVASRVRDEAELGDAVARLRGAGDAAAGEAALGALASAVLSHRLDGAFRSPEIERLRGELRELEDLRRQLADRDAHLLEQRRRNDELRDLVDREIQARRDARLLGVAGLFRRLRARRRGDAS